MAYIPTYVGLYRPLLSTISVHYYALTACGNPDITMEQLLYGTGTSPPYEYKSLLGLTNATESGLEWWAGESNSISCGGVANVSNAFGSALWAVDWMFNLMDLGFTGVNFHGTGDAIYSPWDATSIPPTINPLYYAMLAVARTIGGKKTYLMPNASTEISVSSTQPAVTVRSLLDIVTGVRKIIINHRNISSTAPDAVVNITFSEGGYSQTAAIVYLQAPSWSSLTGVTLNGQTLDGSVNGQFQGSPTNAVIQASAPNTWVFTMKPATTAFLYFTPATPTTSASAASSLSSSGLLDWDSVI